MIKSMYLTMMQSMYIVKSKSTNRGKKMSDRKKYWIPNVDTNQKAPFSKLKEAVNKKRVKNGLDEIESDGKFIRELIRFGANNLDALVDS